MPLTTGARLGPYEIAGALGAGGMGEVYRARDTKLNRDVAIKVLPESIGTDPDRLARFHREAQVLASLNHPNIAAIYGFEDSGITHALIMELVEGPTLAEKLGKSEVSSLKSEVQPVQTSPFRLQTSRALPVTEALHIARQLAEALETAHEQGIVHRDLKPANIKVRPDGTVKVLDFGLAKLAERPAEAGRYDGGVTASPTLTSPALMTGTGLILGTAAYMAPEQAAGKIVDRRADIWSFGVVLWEMLTGRRLFDGETVSHTLADVLRAPIDFDALPARTPRAITELVKRCLDRDVTTRLRDIGEARIVIQKQLTNPAIDQQASGSAPVAAPVIAPSRPWFAWGVAGTLALVVVGLAWVHLREPQATSRRIHLTVPLQGGDAPGFFALSPDGRWLAARYQDGLSVRSLETGETHLFANTQGSRAPFWSPDSRTVAFFSAARKLMVVPTSGGVPQALCDADGGGGGTWNRAGTILFSSTGVGQGAIGGGLFMVPATGGPCAPVATESANWAATSPVFLPDGDHFFYFETRGEGRGVYVASLREPKGKRLLGDVSTAIFAPESRGSNRGRLLFIREQSLMAQPFDAGSLELSGEPFSVARPVSFQFNAGQIAASVSEDGTLVYAVNARPDRQLVWYDRAGSETGRAAVTGNTNGIFLSPDGKRVAFQRADESGGPSSHWIEDLERGQESRLPREAGDNLPVWSPDGQRLAFSSNNPSRRGIYARSVSGGTEEKLLEDTGTLFVSDWSRDGRWIAYTGFDPATRADVWLLPASPAASDRKPVPLLRGAANESQAQFSPDGKWVAYFSDEDGIGQVYLRRFDNGSASEARWQISASKTRSLEPRWRADGKELFYLEGNSGAQRIKLYAVSIADAPNPVGAPKPLFDVQSLSTLTSSNIFLYAPSPDGQRFLINVFASNVPPTLEAILNWASTSLTAQGSGLK